MWVRISLSARNNAGWWNCHTRLTYVYRYNIVYKNAKDWQCPYCNIIIKSRRKLHEHFKNCDKKEKLEKDSLGRVKIPGIGKKSAETFKKKVEAGLAKYKGHAHTEESKKKISEKRLLALKEGRGNHWICPLLHRSYAEQYFYDIFTNKGVEFENNVWLCKRYCVDFLFGTFYFEVDGEQHYTDDAIKHDNEREVFLLKNGYKCIGRCRWKDFNRLSFEQKEEYINGLVAQLAEANGSNPFQCEFESHPVY